MTKATSKKNDTLIQYAKDPFMLRMLNILGKACLTVASLGIIALLSGYVYFSTHIQNVTGNDMPTKTDGIVVLTGDVNRLKTAFELLDANVGKRLLISGVNKITSKQAIFKTFGYTNLQKTCCIDIDKVAQNTAGNAHEAAIWAKKLNYKSLTIVTSDYHMMRSLLEFEKAMPHIKLIAYPANAKDILSNNQYLRTKLREYGKLLTAIINSQFPHNSQSKSFASASTGA